MLEPRIFMKILPLAALLQACATTSGAMDAALKRASFDLDCESSQINVVELSQGNGGNLRTIGVSGCGRKAVYLVRGSALNGYIAVLNSPTDKSEGEP